MTTQNLIKKLDLFNNIFMIAIELAKSSREDDTQKYKKSLRVFANKLKKFLEIK